LSATSTALAAAWTPVPARPALSRTSSRRDHAVGRAAAAVLVLTGLTLGLLGGAAPQDDLRASERVRPAVESGPQPIEVGQRVPPTGTDVVAAGSVHRFRFSVAAGASVFLEAIGDSCDYLLPWTLTDARGGRVAQGLLCGVYGPMDLSKGGTFDLRVGGDKADGRYAFRLTAR
jgi:hypothetical protein